MAILLFFYALSCGKHYLNICLKTGTMDTSARYIKKQPACLMPSFPCVPASMRARSLTHSHTCLHSRPQDSLHIQHAFRPWRVNTVLSLQRAASANKGLSAQFFTPPPHPPAAVLALPSLHPKHLPRPWVARRLK